MFTLLECHANLNFHSSYYKINNHLKALQIAAEENDVEMIRSQLKQLVKGYQPDEKVVDWIYVEEHSGQV